MAEAALTFLREHGIGAIVQGSDFAGTGMPAGFDLHVQERDSKIAHGFLEMLYDGI